MAAHHFGALHDIVPSPFPFDLVSNTSHESIRQDSPSSRAIDCFAETESVE